MATPRDHSAKYRAIVAKNQYHRTFYPIETSTSSNLHGDSLYHNSDQNTSFVQLLGPLMTQLGQHMSLAEKLDLELYDGKRKDTKHINHELLDQDMHILYQALATQEGSTLSALFKQGIKNGKPAEKIAEELVKKFKLRSKVNSISPTVAISHPLPHDLNFHGAFYNHMPAYEGSNLDKLLNTKQAQEFYELPISPMAVLGKDHYNTQQETLKSIHLDSKSAPDPFRDNSIKTLQIYDNFFDIIENKTYENWTPDQFLAVISEQRHQSKQLEKAMRFFFGSHQNAIAAENINETEVVTNLSTQQITQHLSLIQKDLDYLLNKKFDNSVIEALHGLRNSLLTMNQQKNHNSKTQSMLVVTNHLLQKVEKQLPIKKSTYYRALNDLESQENIKSPSDTLEENWEQIDFEKVNPHSFAVMNAFLTNPHILGYQFYDADFNSSFTETTLQSFKEQALLKSMHAIKKQINGFQPTYKIHTHTLHDNQPQKGAERFSELVNLGVINQKGEIMPLYQSLSIPEQQETFASFNLDPESLSALQHACQPNSAIDLDQIDTLGLNHIRLETPQGKSSSLYDVFMLINQGEDVDEKYENTLTAYSIFLDMFKSMTHFHKKNAQDYTGKAVITASDENYQMDVYANATWQAADADKNMLNQQGSLTITSNSKESLEKFYLQIQKILVQLEPIIRVGYQKESHMLSHNQHHGVSKIPIQILHDNQGQWDFENNRVISMTDSNYKLGIDRLLTPDYFDMEVHHEARKTFSKNFAEVKLANSLKLQMYNDINSREEDQKKKKSQEKTEKELKEEKARDKEDFRAEVRSERQQEARVKRQRKERDQLFRAEESRRRAQRQAENKRLSKRRSNHKPTKKR